MVGREFRVYTTCCIFSGSQKYAGLILCVLFLPSFRNIHVALALAARVVTKMFAPVIPTASSVDIFVQNIFGLPFKLTKKTASIFG